MSAVEVHVTVTVAQVPVRAFQISGAPGLDPIRVVIFNDAPGAGRIILNCYSSVWTAYWGSMGNGWTVEKFFLDCGSDYLLNCLCYGRDKRPTRHETAYLTRIIQAVQAALVHVGGAA